MKIAVAALNSSIESHVSSYPLRAPYILLFDESGGFLEALKNPFNKASGHKGYGMARFLNDNMVDMLIARNFPPSMDRIFREAGIQMRETETNTNHSISDYISPGPELDTTQA